MIFDWTITLGNIATIVAFLGGGVLFLVNAYSQFKSIQTTVNSIGLRMNGMEEELKKQTEILVNQAAQRERMIALERRVDELYDKLYKKIT